MWWAWLILGVGFPPSPPIESQALARSLANLNKSCVHIHCRVKQGNVTLIYLLYNELFFNVLLLRMDTFSPRCLTEQINLKQVKVKLSLQFFKVFFATLLTRNCKYLQQVVIFGSNFGLVAKCALSTYLLPHCLVNIVTEMLKVAVVSAFLYLLLLLLLLLLLSDMSQVSHNY